MVSSYLSRNLQYSTLQSQTRVFLRTTPWRSQRFPTPSRTWATSRVCKANTPLIYFSDCRMMWLIIYICILSTDAFIHAVYCYMHFIPLHHLNLMYVNMHRLDCGQETFEVKGEGRSVSTWPLKR